MTLEELLEAAVVRAVDRHMGAIRADIAAIKRAQAPQFITIAQAAEALSCHKNTVRRMVRAGTIGYKVVGTGRNGIRIDASTLHGAGGGDEVSERRAARGGRG